MAALNDCFLADLDELSDNEDDLLEAEHTEEEEDLDANIEALNYDDDDLDSVSKLQKTQRYTDIMQKVEEATVLEEDDPEYQLIFDSSTTSGKPLPEEVLEKTIDACDRALALDSSMKKCCCCKANGDSRWSISVMPACDVQLLSAKRKNLAGFSTATLQFRVGYLEQTEIFQSTPPSLRMRVCRLLAAKSTPTARVDSVRGDPTGKTGRTFRAEIEKKIEKGQESAPAKQPKPLRVLDSEPKKKRGGRRLRKMKERYAITDMRKPANRMQFGVLEESSLGDVLWEGYGMLGQAGNASYC
ncbi:hypothetical protein BUALT_Bualt16G0039600 [Buddleja alternifolia]|uniref:Nop domain-containing protein n=1 Tax=Buddleja alternifolia TaxID=168488 RepID=A0AAV6W6J5_9LAMI|nr:hypothetical protein BUALT_Bualt16G0039600 [Buddleja alternifolia]